ncbi:helix-turn-helix domain-containing protein [Trueperella bernardiae]|uniref:helix-turn-helix domain-containing protein n=1 Tax=Trueperella bernardiae TaxID=59561 RepID=UPI002552F387|nr:helix-turn-helix domain-containing protein [Trueperella bernardiae]WIM07978.1 helix-turn-helix domain-containing protein [Trueperella bernardiae]
MCDELLTTRQVAELAKVSRQTVSRWASEGKIPAVTLPGGQLRFSKVDVDAMLTPTTTSERSEAEAGVPLPGQAVLL